MNAFYIALDALFEVFACLSYLALVGILTAVFLLLVDFLKWRKNNKK